MFYTASIKRHWGSFICFTFFALVVCLSVFRLAPDNQDEVLMKNISDLHFQLFSFIHRKTKMKKVKKKKEKE